MYYSSAQEKLSKFHLISCYVGPTLIHNNWNDVLERRNYVTRRMFFLTQGVWKIQVNGESHERGVQYFEVCEFVLPKFEVNINAPPFLTYNQEEDKSVQKIHISVCAK